MNSTTNQTIKGQFVGKEVFANVNSMVEYILRSSYEDREAPFSYDDLTNYYKDNSEAIDGKQEEIDDIKDSEKYCELDNKYSEDELNETEELEYNKLGEAIENIESSIQELESDQEEPQEVFEWYMVSNYLARKLQERGEVVIEGENIWGRCTTGQAILLDSVISEICYDMEILEGQKNEWK